MVTLGRILIVIHCIFLLLATVILVGSIAALIGGGGHMQVSGLIVLLAWLLFIGMTIKAVWYAGGMSAGRSDRVDDGLWWAKVTFLYVTILSIVTGLGLAFLAFVGCGPLWVPNLFHWAGLIATILGFLAVFLLPVFIKANLNEDSSRATSYYWAYWVFFPLGVATLWGLAWLIPYLLLKDHVNLTDYAASDRLYQLPFPGGESSWVIQGNDSSLNHNNDHNGQKFSWDLRRRCGTPVLAARAGTIQSVTDTNDGIGGDNNQISIAHPGGSVSFYLHIEKGSVPARFRTVGAAVAQGDEIAKVGSVGNSMTGHIHFMVKRGGTTIGASFTDVSEDNGIPRTFSSYTSGNRRVP